MLGFDIPGDSAESVGWSEISWASRGHGIPAAKELFVPESKSSVIPGKEPDASGSRAVAAPGAGRAGKIFRILCIITAIANMGGNALLLVAHGPIFRWLGLPIPDDLYTFTSVLGFSFTSGVVALMIVLMPAQAVPLLVVGIVGKGLFAITTLVFHTRVGLQWPWLVFGAFDATMVCVFFLYLIHLCRPELLALNQGAIVPGSIRPRTRKALLLYYSLSGNARLALERVQAGLESKGYTCTPVQIRPVERALFQFPFRSLWSFGRILVRAVLRRRAAIEPLDQQLAEDHDHDLIVVAAQTWMVGVAAPVEELFLDPRTRGIFRHRDVAIVNVSRGLWRRSQAMLASHVQAVGGHLVAASAHTNPGREPFRTLSLFVFLLFGGKVPGWVPRFLRGPQRLSDSAQARLVRMGEELATRPQVVLSADDMARIALFDAQHAELPRRVTEDTWDAVVPPVVQAVAARGSVPEVIA
jgi:hypothetical protein